jgi:hypothetical protein
VSVHDGLKRDLEDVLIFEFLDRGTTWEQIAAAMNAILTNGDPRSQEDRIQP